MNESMSFLIENDGFSNVILVFWGVSKRTKKHTSGAHTPRNPHENPLYDSGIPIIKCWQRGSFWYLCIGQFLNLPSMGTRRNSSFQEKLPLRRGCGCSFPGGLVTDSPRKKKTYFQGFSTILNLHFVSFLRKKSEMFIVMCNLLGGNENKSSRQHPGWKVKERASKNPKGS